MRCVMCGVEADVIFYGMSLCIEHYKKWKKYVESEVEPTGPPGPFPVRGGPLPQLDPDELENLGQDTGRPWTSYQTKQRCKPGEAGWIFTNTQGAEALVDLIQSQGRDVPVTMGGGHIFLVRFSGKDDQFISRRPKKEKKR